MAAARDAQDTQTSPHHTTGTDRPATDAGRGTSSPTAGSIGWIAAVAAVVAAVVLAGAFQAGAVVEGAVPTPSGTPQDALVTEMGWAIVGVNVVVAAVVVAVLARGRLRGQLYNTARRLKSGGRRLTRAARTRVRR